MTADVGGVITNRVRVKRQTMTGKRAKAAYRKDPTTRGLQVAVMTADVGGVIANRVRVKRQAMTGKRAKAAYRKDPTTRGLQVAVICVSLPAIELVRIDDACERAQMARSHFLREAAKQLIEQLGR